MGVTAIILAGGKSSRFGRDKSLLVLDSKLLVRHLADCCATFADEILIISNQDQKFGFPGIRELSDRYTNMGPLGGIHAGLCEASHEHIFVTACDMPFFQVSLAETLLARLHIYDAAMPCHHALCEPLFSAMRRTEALAAAEMLLQQGDRKVLLLFDRINTFCWNCTEEDIHIFYNINYPDDYDRLTAGIQHQKTG